MFFKLHLRKNMRTINIDRKGNRIIYAQHDQEKKNIGKDTKNSFSFSNYLLH